ATNTTTSNATFTVCGTLLGTNVYTATITDNNGCVGSCTATNIVNPNPVCSIAPPSAELCFGPEFCTTYTVTPANGEAPYRIVWSRGGIPIATNTTSTSATFTVCGTLLGTNVYTATITDNNGCIGSCTATNIVTPNPLCSIEPPTAEVCFGPQNCASYLVTPFSGAPPYRIVWSGPGGPIATNITSSNATFSVCGNLLGTNIYTASITDSNGCVGSCTAINIVNPNPICRISPPTAELCFGPENCIDYVVTPLNGEAPYRIVWSGIGGPIQTNLVTNSATFRVCATVIGTNVYTASITDNNGCVGSCTATNIVNPNPTCTVTPPTNEVCVGFSATFTVVPTNGTPGYQFSWTGPAGFVSTNQTITISNAQLVNAGFYVVVVTDSKGCTSTCQGRLIVNPNPVCTVTPPTNAVCAGFSATFGVIPSSGTAPYT